MIGCSYEYYKDAKLFGILSGDIAYCDVNRLFAEFGSRDVNTVLEVIEADQLVWEHKDCSCRLTLHMNGDTIVHMSSEKTHPDYWKRKQYRDLQKSKAKDLSKYFLPE